MLIIAIFQSLRDCTSGMDPDAWNAYHIISNRARSVCYATRNQQFRLKTEYLVNQLAHTAGDQMDFLEKLKVRMKVCYITLMKTLDWSVKSLGGDCMKFDWACMSRL